MKDMADDTCVARVTLASREKLFAMTLYLAVALFRLEN